jgi:predicted metal-binding membrane protein
MSADTHQAAQDAAIVVRHPWKHAVPIMALSLIGWALMAWMALDMDHPVAQLMMPASSMWTIGNLCAILSMWAVMMAAMMLPSALPTLMTFARLCDRAREYPRFLAFVGTYLLVWFGFSVAATAIQWVLQYQDLVSPMIVSTSVALTGMLLVIAGVYQFSPLKRVCLANCRTPIGFLLGEWRPGIRGAVAMGLRHGWFCFGCCWALMVLLFVGGAMNIAWIAALSIAVAIEKMLPHGDKVSLLLGVGLIVAGAIRLSAIS